MNDSNFHVVFAGGGTAGHLFPGLAVARRLRQETPTLRISFVGAGKSFERQHVSAAGFEYFALACRPLPRGPFEAWRFVTENLSGYYAARRLVRETNVSLVVGLGGYASVPMARAAGRRKLPVVLLEQNAVPGRATRWLARHAALVCLAMSDARGYLAKSTRVRVTGNPIHRHFENLPFDELLDTPIRQNHKRLIVLGGSGGAKALNEQVPLALYKAGPAIANWTIVHQTGQQHAAATAELYRKLGLTARVIPFLDNMAHELANADFAISRSGGTTLAEFAAAGVPALLLPYPFAKDDHQRHNAQVFVDVGGCQIIDERDQSARLDDRLAAAIVTLAGDSQLRLKMSQVIRRLARPEAAATVAAAIYTLLTEAPARESTKLQSVS